MTNADQTPTFDEYAIVELLGHRRVAGRVREVQLAGAGFLRIDIPATDGHAEQTQFVSPGSVYALHPTTEDIATAVAARCRPEPVSRWELPAAPDPEPDAAARECCDDGRFHPCQQHDPDGYAEWAADGMATAVGPDPDYGRDLDDDEHAAFREN